jgi:predicted GIY-YIG superfamily endonuclease
MPFDHPIPRPLTANGVRTYAPSVSGVYGLSNADEWIYIGQSDDIRTALLTHLREDGGMLGTREYVGFVYGQCAGERRSQRQEQLMTEYPRALRTTSRRMNQTALQRRLNDK